MGVNSLSPYANGDRAGDARARCYRIFSHNSLHPSEQSTDPNHRQTLTSRPSSARPGRTPGLWKQSDWQRGVSPILRLEYSQYEPPGLEPGNGAHWSTQEPTLGPRQATVEQGSRVQAERAHPRRETEQQSWELSRPSRDPSSAPGVSGGKASYLGVSRRSSRTVWLHFRFCPGRQRALLALIQKPPSLN